LNSHSVVRVHVFFQFSEEYNNAPFISLRPLI